MSEPAESAAFSDDTLLGGRVRLRQPLAGYRVAIDPVLLAASVPARGGERVLDIGCGVGAAALCLAHRVAGVRVSGIDSQRDIVRLASDNIRSNGLEARVDAMVGDLLRPPPRLEPGTCDFVMANPPYLERARAAPSPDAAAAASEVEGEADLGAWVRFALAMLRPKGGLVFIHRADRIEQLLAQLAGRTGAIVIFPLWPGGDRPARRVIVQARKGMATPTQLLPGLVLHDAAGHFTPAAEQILRDGAALVTSL